MRSSPRRRLGIVFVTLATIGVTAGAAVAESTETEAGTAGLPRNALLVRIDNVPGGPPIASGLVGLSLEYSAIPAYAGNDPSLVDPVFEQLIRNISPGQSPVLRIGGDSTDWTWWPVAGIARPGGVRYSLTPGWLSVTRALSQALGAHLILGLNLEANSRILAAGEAQALVTGIGASSIGALELGNEPELYASFPWYQSPAGHRIKGRAPGYGPADYTREVTRLAPSLPGVPLAGPATGAPKWMAYLRKFVAAEPCVGLVTLHRYATRGCFVSAKSPQYHTIGNLLSSAGTRGLAASVAPYVRLKQSNSPPVRIDELNSVNCGGVSGVSDTFASALWAMDTMFEMARIGVSGVNFHTFPGAKYEPFDFRRVNGMWQGTVKPIYYGMLMFAQAASPGSRLLQGSGSAGKGIHVWALRAPDRQLRVVLINYGTSGAQSVAVRLPVGSGLGTVERLRAPRIRSRDRVTIGGQSFGSPTGTGTLAGSPHMSSVNPIGGDYVVRLPAASAALLTVGR